MPNTLRRKLAVVLTVGVLLVVVVAMQRRETPTHTIRIVFGLQDKAPTDWSGSVKVAGGELVEIHGWRFQDKDKILAGGKWRCKSRAFIAHGKRVAIQNEKGALRYPTRSQVWSNGVTIHVKGDNPTITVKLPSGQFQLRTNTLLLGDPKSYLNGDVRVERMPQSSTVRPASTDSPKSPNAYQDDYPAFHVDAQTGKQYLAWVSYRNERDQVLLSWRDGSNGLWSKPQIVAGKGHHFRTALAATRDGVLWITWSSQKENNWDLFARSFAKGKLGKTVRLTRAKGPDLWHRMTTDNKGRAWLVWQGFRNGQSDIFARFADGDNWRDAVKVSESKRNDWDPCIAADAKSDRVWIGWDTYTGENYSARVVSLTGGEILKRDKIQIPEDAPLFQAHVSLACDGAGRLWAAWDESGPQWGKDTGFLYGGQDRQDTSRLYSSRTIRVRVLERGKWLKPKQPFTSCLSDEMKEYNEYPQLHCDYAGRVWLAFRHRTCIRPREDGWAVRGRWDLYATAFLGDRWLSPTLLPNSGGRNDMRTSSQQDAHGNVYFAYATDNRRWFPSTMLPRNHQIVVSKLDEAAKPKAMQLVTRKRNYPIAAPCHPREKDQITRIRKYKIESGGKTYRIYRGDLHRHTDISTDGIGDGSLMDMHRYAHDAAGFDFIMVGDHNMGNNNEYCWWRTQHANDLYTVPGSFISMYGYERSMRFPRGHRNVIWAERGHRAFPLPKPIPALFARDTERLYAELRRTGGICTSHTSASNQGTDWKDKIDPKLEPIVEVFQGFHAAYESSGAPKSVSEKMMRIHGKFQPAGFVSNALNKGYKLGFQASSDHISTHVSYACILATEFSRKGLIDAMKRRHTYAATDNIIMDVRMANGIMGDQVVAKQPTLRIKVVGTSSIKTVEVIRDNKVIHTISPKPGIETVNSSWRDPAPNASGISYYYVRVLQRDGQMAWASPIWVRSK